MNPELSQFLYKVAASLAVGVIVTAILWPFRKVRKEWIALKSDLADTHAELVTQRTNCLQTLQNQGSEQIALLGKTVAALDGVRLDLAAQTGYLSAMAAQPLHKRRAAKK